MICLVLGVFGLWQMKLVLRAEQVGGSPDSGGSNSRITIIVNDLISKGIGSTGAGTWGDWGVMWNRIYSVAEIDYSHQALQQKDDYANDGTDTWTTEESVWLNTVADAGNSGVYKDTRTGLYWSPIINIGTSQTTAITLCDNLTMAFGGVGDTGNWYLPTQKELMQASIDGIYNQTKKTWVSTWYFWSSSERSAVATSAYIATLYNGGMYSNTKTISEVVRCVRRD